MENLKLIKVEISDLKILQKIWLKTFTDTFSSTNSKENLDIYIQENISFRNLEREFQNENSEFYFAKLNNEITGYLKLNFKTAQTENYEKSATEIQRIYILKEFQGKKIGQFLINHAIEIAKKKKSKFIWLGVWEKNYSAIGFYEKHRFSTFEKHEFKLGNDSQTDLIMKLILN